MKVAFITEAGDRIGFGHLYRAIALAQVFISAKRDVIFFCNNQSAVDILNTTLAGITILHTDEVQSNAHSCDILIVDVHKDSFEKFKQLEESTDTNTVSIIDYAFRANALKTDYVFQIGYQDYEHKVEIEELPDGKKVRVHSGSDFLIFRDEFKNAPSFVVRQHANKVLVSMGGSDPCQLTEFISQAVEFIQTPLKITYILGVGFNEKRLRALKSQLEPSGHEVSFLQNIDNMAEMMLSHDVAVINGGNTRFELAGLGIPFLAISINSEQKMISDKVAGNGIGISLGQLNELDLQTVSSEVQSLLDNFEKRKNLSKTMVNQVSIESSGSKIQDILNQKVVFRKLTDAELETAYSIHCDVVEYLLDKRIRQWLRPIDFKKLKKRQKQGENFGLFINDELHVFLSLVRRSDYHEWENEMPDQNTIWLNTVSVNVRKKIKGIGAVAIKHVFEYLVNKGIKELYLDCVVNDGFLVRYYQDLGFVKLKQEKVQYRSGKFTVALMKKTF